MTFDVQYWDPPWKFRNEKTGGSHKSGAAQKYRVMELAQIQQLPVASVSRPSSVLFLWVPTALKFSHGFTTALAWGFPFYKTTWYWQKERLGMGFWGRNMVEELLIFTRGSVAPFMLQEPNMKTLPEPGAVFAGGELPDIDIQPEQLTNGCLTLPANEHSEKPEEFRRMVEVATQKFSVRDCLEGFARRRVTGWTGIGNVVTGQDIRTDLRQLAALTEDQLLERARA